MKTGKEINIDLLAPAIEQALLRKGWSQHDLAKATGISQSSISGYLARQKTPRRGTTKKLIEALGLSWQDIGVEIDEPEAVASEPRTSYYSLPSERLASASLPASVVLVPRSGIFSAEQGPFNEKAVHEAEHESDDAYDPYPRFELARLSGSNPDQLRSAVVVGDSLAPEIAPNTRVIYLPVERFSGDGLYVVMVDGTEVVKRIQVLPGGTLCFLPINPAYRSVDLTPLPDADTPNTYRLVETGGTSVIIPRGKVVFYPKSA